jgi:hypothetical protein
MSSAEKHWHGGVDHDLASFGVLSDESSDKIPMDILFCYYLGYFPPIPSPCGGPLVDASCTLYAMVEPWLLGPSADLRTAMSRVRHAPDELSSVLECVGTSCAVTRTTVGQKCSFHVHGLGRNFTSCVLGCRGSLSEASCRLTFLSYPHKATLVFRYSYEMVLPAVPAVIIAKVLMYKCARLSHYLESVVD